MQLKAYVTVLAVVSAVVAGPLHYPRQAGGTPSGKPPGTQFITGNCSSDTDCESTCCDAVTGLCAAKLVAQEDGHGCGFDGSAAAPVASSAVAASVASSAVAPVGTQFITGTCTADADCASTCCDAVTGLCAAKLVAEQDGHGCGFDGSAAAPVAASSAADVVSATVAASAAAATGTQFITGTCSADADCASTCCDAVTGLCAAKLVAEQNGHGCGFDGSAAAPVAASSAAAAAAPASTAGGQPSGKPPGTQFITGNCSSDSDCESTCCDAKTGLCAAVDVATENGHGCGFTPARRFI